MANMPEIAKKNQGTIMMRWIKDFHEKFTSRLGTDNIDTLRSTAWQIEEYLEEHGKYYDAEFIRTLQHSLEKVIQKVGNTPDWTVKKASTSMQGRVTGINQYRDKKVKPKKAPVSAKLSKEISDRMTPKPE